MDTAKSKMAARFGLGENEGGCIGMCNADKKENGRLLTDEQLDDMEKLRSMAIEALTKKYQQ